MTADAGRGVLRRLSLGGLVLGLGSVIGTQLAGSDVELAPQLYTGSYLVLCVAVAAWAAMFVLAKRIA